MDSALSMEDIVISNVLNIGVSTKPIIDGVAESNNSTHSGSTLGSISSGTFTYCC